MTKAQLEHRIRILQDGLDARPVTIDGEALRQARGLISQATIAKDVLGCLDGGRTRRCDVSRWERGVHRPTWLNLSCYCEYIAADPLTFLLLEEEICLVKQALQHIQALQNELETRNTRPSAIAVSEF